MGKKKILIAGLVGCAICALFPPRQYAGQSFNSAVTPTHCFLFSPKFQEFHLYDQGFVYGVGVDGGRLLAELTLIVAITGVCYLARKPGTRARVVMPKAIIKDSASGIVSVGDISVPGWVDDIKPCDHCGSRRIYHSDYDAYFCPACNVWVEHTCNDKPCAFCGKRPDKPLPNPI